MHRLVLIPLVVAACGKPASSSSDAPVPDGFDRNRMLEHLASQVLLPMQTTAATTAADLPAAIGAHCNALDAGTPGTTLDAARAAWATTVDAWQRVEAALLGPAKMNGKALATRIYAWPNVATCEIDRDTAERFANPSGYDIETKLDRRRSLSAIEYLLHPPSLDHTCAGSFDATWAGLGTDVARARCRLAEAVAIDVAAQLAVLETAWQPSGGNYVGELANAGESGSSFSTAHEAVNVVAGALFYVDFQVKDMKLGQPAGLAVNTCGTVGEPCVLEAELRFADRTTAAVRANLVTLREVFTGTTPTVEGPSFDAFLTEIGHADVATRMVGSIDGAITAATAMPDSFLGALTNDYDKIVATHAAVKAFTDDLKSQFLTLLGLELPNDVPADND
jgi:predicted lipoprotein